MSRHDFDDQLDLRADVQIADFDRRLHHFKLPSRCAPIDREIVNRTRQCAALLHFDDAHDMPAERTGNHLRFA